MGQDGRTARKKFNNVEKASRIINVSFSSDAPEKYLDCGMSHRTFEEGDTATKYDYATAEASTYLVAGKWGNFDNLPSTASLRRTTTVEGRANIYVAPKEDKTIVTVNVRYIFGVKVEGVAEYKNGVGTVVQRTAIPSTSNTLSFNTGEIGSANWNGVTVKCASKGTLESQVLRLNSQ